MARKKSDTIQLSKIRMRESLRERLAREAEANDISLNAVIVSRLEKSLAADTRMSEFREYLAGEWGLDIFSLASSAAKAVASVERFTGKRWVEDDRTFKLFTATLAQLAKNYRDIVLCNGKEYPSRRSLRAETDQELVEMFADFSGISPPRKDRDAEHEAASRESSLRDFRRHLAKSRPLPQEGTDK